MKADEKADEQDPGSSSLERLKTGNPQLDLILGGGFPANSINILMGEPGSGKTILAERLLFANAARGDRPILYLTTLSEPLDKVVRYLQQFSFYDESLLGESIVYDSIGDALVADGVQVLVPRLKEAITAQQPKIIVIDSFKAIHDLGATVSDMRRMLYELAGLLTAYEATAFLVGEYGTQDGTYPEFAIADGIVQLSRNKTGSRDERSLRVLKLRGSAYREGLHAFRITPDGLEVFPRLISPRLPPTYRVRPDRVPTGISGLDRMLGGGGLPVGRSTIITGPAGSGKTTLSLQFILEGVRRGDRCLYVNFEENPGQLAEQLAALGSDPQEVLRRGLQFLYRSPVELQIDSIISEIFDNVASSQVKRVVVDGVGDLLVAANDVQRLYDYLYALAQHFSVRNIASLFTYEAMPDRRDAFVRFSALADNIIGLDVEVGEKVRRTLRIIKARGLDHKLEKAELRISRTGVSVS